MHKISRVYVGSCGVNVSWYDGMVLDFTSVDSGEPVDSIINLENGGGKSVLLSLIFSCFETKKDKFLKHLHDTKNRFYQYFSQDGLPGFVAVEWLNSDGHGESRMVTGQVVSRRTMPGSEEIERHFFSFVCGPNLSLESIPGPRLGSTVARNMPEVLQWFQSLKTGKNLFYATKNQADWERHLEKERGLDLSILKLQLEFSRTEGGVDIGFLTFKNEFDFLRMFFDLTLDEERVQNVRQSIATTCEKLHRKPEYESRVGGLSRLLDAVAAFRLAGDKLVNCDDEIFAHKLKATRIGRVIRRAHNNLLDQLAEIRGVEAAEKEKKDIQNSIILEKENLLAAYHVLALHQKVTVSERELKDEQARQDMQRRVSRILQAALKLSEIRSKEKVLSGLKSKRDAIEAGLEDLRQPTIDAGTAYTIALMAHKNLNRRSIDALKLREEQIHSDLSVIQTKICGLNEENNQLNRTQGELQAKMDLFIRERSALVADGLLRGSDDKASLAIENYTLELALKQQSLSKSQAKKIEIEKERKLLTEDTEERQSELVQLDSKVEACERNLRESETMRTEIENSTILEFVVESEAAISLDETLLRSLEDFNEELNRKCAHNAVALAEIGTEKISLETRQLCHPGVEIDTVVEALQTLGVRTARSFAGYLADTIPEAVRARQLIVNNPARYLGVCVQTDEDLSRARQILQMPLDLKRPVMISLVDDSVSPREYGFVMPAGKDVHFNYPAAAQFFEELTELENEHLEFGKKWTEQINECHKTKNELQRYLTLFGEGRLDQYVEKLDRYSAEKTLLVEQIEDSRRALTGLSEQFESTSVEIITLATSTASLEVRLERLRRFQNTLEVFAQDNLNALNIVVAKLDEFARELTKAEREREKLNRELAESKGQLQNLAHAERDYSSKIASVEYNDPAVIEKSYTLETSDDALALEDLEGNYRRAFDLLKKESGARLGSVDAQLTEVEETRKSLQKSFDTAYDDLALDEVEAQLGSDMAARYTESESLLILIEKTVIAIVEQLSANQTLLRQYQNEKKIRDVVKFAQDKLTASEMQSTGKELDEKAEQTAVVLQEKKAQLAAIDQSLSQLAIKMKDLESGNIRFDALIDRLDNLEQVTETELENHSLLDDEIASEIGLDAVSLDNVSVQLKKIAEAQKSSDKERRVCERVANGNFGDLKDAAHGEALRNFEREISDQITLSTFDQALRSRLDWTESVKERLNTTRDLLDSMRADFDQSVEEFIALIDVAIKKLISAATNKKMPDGAPYIGGKTVIKVRVNSLQQSVDVKRQKVAEVLDQLITIGGAPDTGAALVARAVLAIGGNSLMLQLLKFVVDPNEQYVPISKLSNSGGEAVAMAMSLYFVIAQLRAESKLSHKNVTSGPLILDNPFAKATNAALWDAQRSLAKAMGAQLIFATGLLDYNTIAQFGRVLRLRRAGQDKRTERWHIELSDYELLHK